MNETKLTINLSEQALKDLLDGLEIGVQNLNPKYYRYNNIVKIYDKILNAYALDKKKINMLYKKVEVKE